MKPAQIRSAVFLISVVVGLLSLPLLAQQTPSGRWEGFIEAPGAPLKIEVDLAPDAKGGWRGVISIPVQGMKAFPLSDIQVKGGSVDFVLKGIPGTPHFTGALSPDGKMLAGKFEQGPNSTRFELKRTGEAKIPEPPKGTRVAKELEGEWQGSVDTGAQKLRLILRLENGEDQARGTLISPDQGGAEMPITVITQAGPVLKFEIAPVNVFYAGAVSADSSQIEGEWTQGPQTFPVVFRRAAP